MVRFSCFENLLLQAELFGASQTLSSATHTQIAQHNVNTHTHTHALIEKCTHITPATPLCKAVSSYAMDAQQHC